MKVVFIPGLGYDHQIFEKISVGEFNTVYLDWLEPEPNETFRHYSNRLISTVDVQDEHLVIVGHSFGGMIAQEIAAIRKVKGLILLSTITSRIEMPLWMKLIRPLGIYRLPIRDWSSATVGLWGPLHGLRTAVDQTMFKKMVQRYSRTYYAWALGQLSTWRAPKFLADTPVYRIHGELDRTFPLKNLTSVDHPIENGSHVFLIREPEMVSGIIQGMLKKIDGQIP